MKNLKLFSLLLLLCLCLLLPTMALAQESPTLPAMATGTPREATEAATTPAPDVTPEPEVTAEPAPAIIDSATGAAILGWLMGLSAFVIAAIAVLVLGGLFLFLRYGKDRVPADVFDKVRTITSDVTDLLKTELERRHELAKATPTPFDDHLFAALRDFNETVRVLIKAPALPLTPESQG